MALPMRACVSGLSLVVLLAVGCASMSNTLAQDLAWERIEQCKGASLNVILNRVETDGRVWVTLRNGTAGLADWQACMRKAELAQATGKGPSAPPAAAVSSEAAITGPLAAPIWNIGEEWAYRWESPEGKGTYIESLTRQERLDGLDCYVVKGGGSESFYRREDLALVREARSGGAVVASQPPRLQFDWPLSVGKRWEQIVTTEDRQTRATRETPWVWEVTAEETITVPAGTFPTLRIVAHNTRTGALIYEMWYSPTVKWWVRLRYTLRTGIQERELISFKLRAA
jgi:hypothetical protein